MARFEHLMFVCTHERDVSSGKQSCGRRGGQKLVDALKDEISRHKLKGRVRVVASGCLNLCSKGCALVAFRAPVAQGAGSDDDVQNHSHEDETWYTHLDVADAPALFAAHVRENGRYTSHVETVPDVHSTRAIQKRQ